MKMAKRKTPYALDTLDDSLLLDIYADASDNEDPPPVANETAEERAQDKAKQSPLHENYVAPLSFLEDAVRAAQANESFNITKSGESFGMVKEAYARSCYEDIVQAIVMKFKKNRKRDRDRDQKRSMLFIIRGSLGIGKSTFLAYFIVRLRNIFANIAICYAPINSLSANGVPDKNEIRCVVFVEGEKIVEGRYSDVKRELVGKLPSIDLIIMDGCSMPFSLEGFTGTVLVAASPSLFVRNLKNSIIDQSILTMPPLEEQEALAIGKMIGVEESVVKKNMDYMKGITRYLFEPGYAKRKVESAVEDVNAASIMKMVSMQSYRGESSVTVHSLVLWKIDKKYDKSPKFELVSRYAEQLVAKKLSMESTEQLKSARLGMAPLSGAEGYAGALFEAYSIRTLQAGGDFVMRSLDGKFLTPLFTYLA
jgi:hypothetical protein